MGRRGNRFQAVGLALALLIQSIGLSVAAFAQQSQVIAIGILGFQDDSGTEAPTEFGRKIAQDLQRKLVVTYKDTLPRVINPADGAVNSLSVEEVVALGRKNGVKFVVRGGLLAATSYGAGTEGGAGAAVQLYAEVISVDSSTTVSVRAEGANGEGASGEAGVSIEWAKVNITGVEFRNSRFGQALTSAVDQLAAAIYQAMVSPTPQPTAPVETTATDTPPSQGTQVDAQSEQAANTDEELQQLIAQAETLMSSGVGNSESLSALSQALMNLKSALEAKATLLQEAKDTAEADQNIAKHKESLQAAVATLTQQASSGIEGQAGDGSTSNDTGETSNSSSDDLTTSGEKQNLLAKIGGFVGESLNILQKIQEMRSLFRSNQESYQQSEVYPSQSEGEYSMPTEEAVAEVTGVVTEDGAPVEGATVTEPESGATAMTDGNGSYTMPLIAGRLAKLVVSKGSKQTSGQIDLVRGRAAIADFSLQPQVLTGSKMSNNASNKAAIRIIPATAMVSALKTKGKTVGSLKGQIKDPQGKPVARALINLNGFAVARTDSNGQYVFLNVPAGTHRMTIIKNGMNLKAQQVQVMAKKSSESAVQFTAGDKFVRPAIKAAVIVRGAGLVIRGTVHDDERRALVAAKVSAMQPSGAVSVFSDRRGNFELKDLKPGPYRLLATKAGFENEMQTINLRANESREFRLKKSNTAVARALDLQRARLITSNPKRTTTPANQPLQTTQPKSPVRSTEIAKGRLMGRVVDENGKPVAGAIISIAGQMATRTDTEGRYAVADLTQGGYRLGVSRAGFVSQLKTIAIRSSSVTREDFELRSTRQAGAGDPRPIHPVQVRVGTLRGQVVDARTGKTLAAVVLAISGQRGVITDPVGVFTATNLPAGTYQIVARKAGYVDATASVSIRAGETSSITVRLNPSPTVRPRVPVRIRN